MGRGIGHRPAGGDPRRLDRLAEISRAGLDIAHPDPKSLSHSVAAQLGEGVSRSGHSIEIANLAAEGFDPRFTAIDLAVHRREVPPPADAAEQARIDRADALVLVYPVYWWSMPGLLTGWIDRVFANGWAYEYSPDTGVTKKPIISKVYLVAMKTQIGIFDYCGARAS